MSGAEPPPFVSRAAQKLEFALAAFELDVAGLVCADLGCNVGGFTDCLVRRGAERVFAVDTAYGMLHWRLRGHPRVVARERTNALHCTPPEPCGLVTIDLGWTRQRHAIPAALRWLAPSPEARIVTLVKPHYEVEDRSRLVRGALSPADAERVLEQVVAGFPALGAEPLAIARSPIAGAKSARRGRGEGNREYLVLVRPKGPPDRSGT
jgi:23S rRNA (cytidine1920-2'-O)/16S rRNA (cytidine1409-2'-O)-methyltransferase